METKPRIINGVCEFCGIKATDCVHNGNVPAEEAVAPEAVEENVGGVTTTPEETTTPETSIPEAATTNPAPEETTPVYGLAATPAEVTPEPGMIDPNPTPVVPEGENFLKSDGEGDNPEDIKTDDSAVSNNDEENKAAEVDLK